MHPDSSLHDTGWKHPEHQGRLRTLASTVARDLPALHDRVVQVEARTASDDELRLAHTPAFVERMREAADTARREERLVVLDEPDTFASGASWLAAAGSAGAAIEAVEGVVRGKFRNAFAACRPPGHHSSADLARGFCIFNSIAIAARWLQAGGHAQRILIVDWDVHHGNGTQEIFYQDPDVFLLSLHQSPLYPGGGTPEERGEGAGEGTTLNIPLAAGIPREEYLEIFEGALDRVLGVFQPDFILVSCGLDILAGDPLGGQLLEIEDIHRMTRAVMKRANEVCADRLVLLLEGGYDPRRTGQGAVAVLRALTGLSLGDEPEEVSGR